MQKITIMESRNGYLVVDGAADGFEKPSDFAARTWSFNSLDAAIAQIRKVLRAWREDTKAAEPAKQAE